MSIRNEKFNQPIFGSNNLSFNVVPQTGWGESYQFSVVLEFRSDIFTYLLEVDVHSE